jgi:hypothetical protein
MFRVRGSRLLLLLLLGLSLAACGGGDEGDEGEAEGERSAAFAPVCEMSAMSGETGLPGGFPTPDSVTFVTSEKAGPSQIVEGYAEGSLEDVYDTWHDEFESSDYDITFDEREEHDAEISFEGGGQSGQVKLAAECGEEDRLYVRVTSRPTG